MNKGILESIMQNRPTTQDDLDCERERIRAGYTALPPQYLDYGRVLTETAGLICCKRTIGDWIQTIDGWMDAGYQPYHVEAAILAIRKERNPILISRPGSITFKLDGLAALKRSQNYDDGGRYVTGEYAEFIEH
jgi:hypothetical protein